MRSTVPRDRGIRWRPAAWLCSLALIALAVIHLGGLDGWTRTAVSPMLTAPMLTMLLGFVTVVALVVWWTLGSRAPARTRLAGLAIFALLGFGATRLVRVTGLSGDFAPELAWRWTPEPGAAAARAETSRADVRTIATEFDFPQVLGPGRDGRISSVRLDPDWETRPPRLVWKIPVGAGWSGFAVVGELAVTQEQRGDEEWVTAYDLRTGALLWSHADAARFSEAISGIGPRATPAIDDGRVFALGGTGILNALDLATGQRLWSRNVVDENGASIPEYGVSASPLVLGSLVIVGVGGRDGRSLVAHDVETGEPVWAGGDGGPAYSSPTSATVAGSRQILVFNDDYVAGHDPERGTLLWSYPWPGQTQKTSQPVVLEGDRVFVSSGYGIGGKLLQVRAVDDGLRAELLWESRGLKAKFTNVVEHGGYLYGLDDGILVCLDPSDGTRRWKRGRHGHGQILLVGDLIVVQEERGRVVLVEANPEEYVERGAFDAVEGKAWNYPALAGGFLVVRTDREAACWELPLRRG